MRIKKGDEVKIIRGKDKGKTGKIEKVFSNDKKILVLGVNEYKRHMKAKSRVQKSEIITITKPMPVSNAMLICPKCHLPTKAGYLTENGNKVRICKKCKQAI